MKKFSLRQFLFENTVPALLLAALFSSVIYIYSLSDRLIFAAASTFALLYSVAIFLVLDFLKRLNKNWFSTLSLFVLMILLLFIGDSLLETNMVDTAQWFFEPDRFSQIYVGNIFAVIIMFGFVLGAALYYFTQVRFRSVFVFLICMCPFSLFAKSFTDIPVIFTIVIITLFFLLIIFKQTEGGIFSGKNKYSAIVAFIVTVSAGAAFLPKLEYAPYREEFDELITGINIAAPAIADFNSFNDSSSSTKSDDEEKVLFTLYGDNPVYIKRQCFNAYNRDTDLWEYYGDIYTGYNYYDKYISWENPALLAKECGFEMETLTKHTVIGSEQGVIRAIYTPENMGAIMFRLSSLLDYAQKNVYRTPVDEYFVTEEVQSFESYSVTWYDFDIDVEFMLLYTDEFASASSWRYAGDYIRSKNEMRQYHDPLMTEEARRACFDSDKDYEVVRTLTEKVTEGCTNDYEKAAAIESYFKTEEFTYDKNFSVADASIENFLFNTKRGICTDYATAMVLMCREAGLYSRYVEGFLVQKSNAEGGFEVTAADGHAYVQVWLDGYGWTDFDPTSANIYEAGFDPTFLLVGIATLLIALFGVIIFIVRPITAERRFINSAERLRGREQLIRLYPAISRIIHKELQLKMNVLTASELKSSAFNMLDIDLSEFTNDYEQTVYGGISCGDRNYIDFYISLKNAVKAKRKEERRAKKRKI